MAATPQPVFAPPILSLGEGFFDPVAAAEFPKHILRYRNDRAAASVGLDGFSDAEWIRRFGKFDPLPDNLAEPLALRYHGHQFRSYNPQIGDGRGFLFAQLRDREGRLLDLGTKGSGTTPYSRQGDGRLTLKGGVREVLATEMLEALGVATSKSFSLIETGEALIRGDEPSPTRSSVLVRLSHSHIRFGTFQRQAYEGREEGLRRLVDYCGEHFYPHILDAPAEDRPAALLRAATAASAGLCASWMAAGFVHGVLNTDNMNITGESFDYGPYRFLPHLDPEFTAAYFDETGLYAYGRQPEAVAWNCAQLGGALTLIAPRAELEAALAAYGDAYQAALRAHVFRRLGVTPTEDAEADLAFISDLMRWMTRTKAAFEQVFFDWFGGPESEARADASPQSALYAAEDFAALRRRLCAFRPAAPDRLACAYFQRGRPATLLIDEIEAIWSRIDERDDWSAFAAKLDEIAEMRDALVP
ncbi:MAG: YdiU family protein [Parvularculaceae bacterium]